MKIYKSIEDCPIWNFDKSKTDLRYLLKLDDYYILPVNANFKKLKEAHDNIISELPENTLNLDILHKKLAFATALNRYVANDKPINFNGLNSAISSYQTEIRDNISFLFISDRTIANLRNTFHNEVADYLKNRKDVRYKDTQDLYIDLRNNVDVRLMTKAFYFVLEFAEYEHKKALSLVQRATEYEQILGRENIDIKIVTVQKFLILENMAKQKIKSKNTK